MRVSLDQPPACFHADLNVLVAGTQKGEVFIVYFRERETEQYDLDLRNPELLKSPSKSSSQNASLVKWNEPKTRSFQVTKDEVSSVFISEDLGQLYVSSRRQIFVLTLEGEMVKVISLPETI